MRLLCALGLFSALLHVTSCLLIGAFNIQRFGDKKSQNKEVMDIITQIIDRYDIILIQEVLDPDWKVTKRLMDLVNHGSLQFRNISSEPLPLDRIGHKERYLFLYRHNKVSVKGSFQYDECKAGDFDRPPFVVQFSSTQTGVDFVLIPIHTSPSTADEAAKRTEKSKDGYVYKSTVEQLNALVDVVDAAKRKLENNNIVVLGDFNAGSNYVRKGDWKNIRLFTNKNFHWLINDVATTLAEKTIQTHDRIVVTTEMNEGVVKAEVFDFREAYHLKEAKKVSDHFPVEVELKLERGGKLKPELKREVKPKRKPKPERKPKRKPERKPKPPKNAGKRRRGSKDQSYKPRNYKKGHRTSI
ncbi:hypothetical protein KUCAC02_022275 [Chaenocephalus aceratus]|nr:hypothetical protein KUCAC02_022275 [Chaenocephalus aceratus]